MTERIRRLREQSLQAVPRLDAERALLLTEFYRQARPEIESVPVLRSRSFAYILEHKRISIQAGELIVGERGPAPKAVSTYPEICLHTLPDLEALHSRPKVSFAVDEPTRAAYANTVIPFWQGRTMRERLMAEMEPAWLDAYEAGIFTEFQEQRAPGHTVLGDRIYRQGFREVGAEAARRRGELDFEGDPEALARGEELQAMEIAAGALVRFAERHAEELDRLAAAEADPGRRAELTELAAICRHVPGLPPRTFHEALQAYWFVHLGVITELNPWDSFNPGRLDLNLLPFYRRGLADGTLTRERARELLQAFWIKFNNHPAPPKMGVTARESGTYTDFALINVGGVDAAGNDASSDLSHLILEVIEEMRLLQPSSMVQVSKKTPDALLRRALQIVRTGFGQPSLFNTETLVAEMLRQGKRVEDARLGGASGCVETGAFGRECYILSGYFNLPKVLEITLHDGTDPRTGKVIGLRTGDPAYFASFDDLLAAFDAQLRHFLDIKIRGNNRIGSLYARYLPVPFLSLLIDDCLAQGRDYNAGGARYNTTYVQGVGLGSITDSLAAIRWAVYEEKRLAWPALLAALDRDFAGDDALRLSLLREAPKYGNDDERADGLARRVFDLYFAAVDGRPAARGGVHRINLLPTTCHIYFGAVTGALPDGRPAGQPLSEGISPVQGADVHGPTAVLLSAAKLDHVRTGGTLLNQKFSPDLLAGEEGITRLAQLVRTYFRLDGHHVQFNVVSAETLREAQRHPEQHRDLIVRVAGYSDYFNDLSEELQEEIIRRTEHESFGG